MEVGIQLERGLKQEGRTMLYTDLNTTTMKLVNYNRPFPTDIFRFFDDVATRNNYTERPPVNIREMEEAFELEVLAPGRDRELFDIAFNDGVLEISYTTDKDGAGEQKGDWRRQEFKLNDFTRRFQLDDTIINDEDINAVYENGILRLTLPKREEALPKEPRQITVA